MAQRGIRIKGLNELKSALANYPRITAPHIQMAITRSLLRVERLGKQLAPIDTGRLRNSFTTDIKPLRGELEPRVNYAVAIHEGTRPHWPNWRPGSPLADWSRRHGIPAYLVARKISRRGTKARPFLKNALDRNIGNIEFEFAKALNDTNREIAKRVNSAP